MNWYCKQMGHFIKQERVCWSTYSDINPVITSVTISLLPLNHTLVSHKERVMVFLMLSIAFMLFFLLKVLGATVLNQCPFLKKEINRLVNNHAVCHRVPPSLNFHQAVCFHKTWYECYVIGGHPTAIIFILYSC